MSVLILGASAGTESFDESVLSLFCLPPYFVCPQACHICFGPLAKQSPLVPFVLYYFFSFAPEILLLVSPQLSQP